MSDWKSEFLKYLVKPVGSEPDYVNAYLLKDVNLPKSIFKYRKIDENSLSNLENNKVWFSNPSEYNDPYDSSLNMNLDQIRVEMTDQANIEAEKSLLHTGFISESDIDISLTPNQRHLKVMEAALKKDKSLAKVSPEKIVGVLDDFLKKELKEILQVMNDVAKFSIKVCSFSERNDSVSMWSHYADYHKGFCIEYSTDDFGFDNVRRRALYPVFYSDKIFDVTSLINLHDKKGFNILFPTLAALHKSIEWKYEHEWRLVLPTAAFKDTQKYEMPKPRAVYLGARIKDEDKGKEIITKICETNGIPIFYMRLEKQEFKISTAK